MHPATFWTWTPSISKRKPRKGYDVGFHLVLSQIERRFIEAPIEATDGNHGDQNALSYHDGHHANRFRKQWLMSSKEHIAGEGEQE